ncbi:hypothetical protein FQN57_002756 [Myotisia sp. PD_48]|nr:hypothetical protein FQN57_002756 [Myotisia sp. PD_48]
MALMLDSNIAMNTEPRAGGIDAKTATDIENSPKVSAFEHEKPSMGCASPPNAKHAGTMHMEGIHAQLTPTTRFFFFGSILLVGYAMGLDILVRNTYQGYATSSFRNHSLLSTVNVVHSVVGAVLQPTLARIADVFGRLQVLVFVIICYTTGTIIETCANNVQTYAAGAMVYHIGYVLLMFILQVIIADLTSMRSRVFFAALPNVPYIINTWISGNVTSAILATTTWRWGIGMWAIIFPVCCAPLVFMLILLGRESGRNLAAEEPTSSQQSRTKTFFQQLDIIGLLLLTSALSMILIPLTLAGGTTAKWRTAGIITPLAIGVLCVPAFIFWEKRAPYPILPYPLLKDRAVWAPLGVTIFYSFSYFMQADFLYTMLLVAFGFSIESSTRVASISRFGAVVSSFILGLTLVKVRRLKPYMLFGIGLWFISFGLLFQFRGGASSSSQSGVIGAEVLLGISSGFLTCPVVAAIQSASGHEHVAVLTALLLTVNNIGSALGNCVSGAIWTQTMYHELNSRLAQFGNETLAEAVYRAPLFVVPEYPVGTPERTAIIDSYRVIQRFIITSAMCLIAVQCVFAFFLRNPKLSKTPDQTDMESEEVKMPSVDK